MNKQPKITAATKQAFIDAYFQLRKQKPLSKITVKEITNITGNNRSTFYRYFKDIYMLDDAFLDYVYRKIGTDILSNMKNLNDVKTFSSDFVKLYYQWKDYIDIIFSDIYNLRIVNKLNEELKKQFIQKDKIDTQLLDYYVNAYITMTASTLGNWVHHKDIPLEKIGELIFYLINNGFSQFLNNSLSIQVSVH